MAEPMEWDSNKIRFLQMEKMLTKLGQQVHGQIPMQAARIESLIEQIDELRQELKRVADKQDKMGTWIKANIPKKDEAE